MAEKIHITLSSHRDEAMRELNKKIDLVLAEMGEIVEKYAKGDCPVDTGLLRNSITYAISGKAATGAAGRLPLYP